MKGAMEKAEELGQNHPEQLHAPAVQQPGQSGDPSQDHGRGDLERHGREGRYPGGRRRHRRDHHRGCRRSSRSESRGSRPLPWSPMLPRFSPAENPARTRSRGSGRVLCPRSSTGGSWMRSSRFPGRRCRRNGPAAGQKGRNPCRDFQRSGRVGCAPGGQTPGEQGKAHRGGPPRHGGAVSFHLALQVMTESEGEG